jgi:hypothetical protein
VVTLIRKVEPFVLRNKQRLPAESAPNPWEVYDSERQLWVDARSGEPLVGRTVLQDANGLLPSPFGETLLTATVEGADQSEISASPFGETSMTKTVEGTDQAESISAALPASPFGETTLTRTREGTDETEGLRHSNVGETTITETREGADQPDSALAGDLRGW